MKKSIAICSAMIFLILCFTGCSGSKDHEETQAQAQMQTTPATEDQKLVADGIHVIDVFAGVDVTDGYYSVREYTLDGCGLYTDYDLDVNINEVEYDKSNSDVKEFLKDIDVYFVEYDELDYKLRNGDVITLGLEYSKSTAEALGITLLEETKTYTVDWLREVYRDASEVTQADLGEIFTYVDPVAAMEHSMGTEWYSTDDATQGPDHYENFTYTTDCRTFYEYRPDGNGEMYIHYLHVLVHYHHEADWYSDNEFSQHVVEDSYGLYSVQMDKSGDPYVWSEGVNERNIHETSWCVMDYDGNIGDYRVDESGALIPPDQVMISPSGSGVYANVVIEEFDMN